MDSLPTSSSGSGRFDALSGTLKRRFRSWESGSFDWDEASFSDLALRAFSLQFERVPTYRKYCRRRGVDLGSVADWRDVPAVPTAAFRVADLVVGAGATAALVFRTSGTTAGLERRGRHLIRDAELYRTSLEAAFRRFVIPDDSRPSMIALQRPFDIAGASSLAWMIDAVLARFGAPGSGHAVEGGRLDWGRATAMAMEACEAGSPVCVLGTTLAFGAWTEWLGGRGIRLRLPEGSRAMDTGGVKGRRGLSRERVVERMIDRLGLDPCRIVNELGMTELCSQRYAPTDPADLRASGFDGPPWLRTRALDPVTLEPVAHGEEGVLCHFDLANAGSICHVLTEDLGRVRDGVVEWRGRLPDAGPRGCSLATAELLAAQSDG